jgi:regulator of replication initiation timing
VATRGVDFEPIDRLEEKVRLLVAMVERMKSEKALAVEENQVLTRELEKMSARAAAAEAMTAEVASLKDERDTIRTRVSDMLTELEALSL